MPQSQDKILLHLLNGERRTAVKTGNNAAWLCPCGDSIPLIGYSDLIPCRESSMVVCKCGSKYLVVSITTIKGKVDHVQQLCTEEGGAATCYRIHIKQENGPEWDIIHYDKSEAEKAFDKHKREYPDANVTIFPEEMTFQRLWRNFMRMKGMRYIP